MKVTQPDLETRAAPEPSSAAKRVVCAIPAYNEDRFIGSVVIKAKKYVDTVVVIDDGSSDGTREVAEGAGARLVCHAGNLGKGAALNSAFQEARKLGADVLVLLDADAQHRPEEIPALLQPILEGRADMAVGSRFLEVQSAVPRYRIIGQQFLTWVTNAGSGVKLTDSQSGFRAFSRSAIQAMSFQGEGFSVESEMQFLAQRYGLQVQEVPIHVDYPGQAKRSAIAQGLQVLNRVLWLVGQHRPLLFFTLLSLFFAVPGLLLSVEVADIYTQTGFLTVGLALIAILLLVMSIVAFFTGIILHTLRGFLTSGLRER